MARRSTGRASDFDSAREGTHLAALTEDRENSGLRGKDRSRENDRESERRGGRLVRRPAGMPGSMIVLRDPEASDELSSDWRFNEQLVAVRRHISVSFRPVCF